MCTRTKFSQGCGLDRAAALIEKLRDRVDQLRRRERLGQQNAVRNALRVPFVGVRSRDVNYWKPRLDRSGAPGDLPPVQPAKQIDVSHKRAVLGLIAAEKSDRLFS